MIDLLINQKHRILNPNYDAYLRYPIDINSGRSDRIAENCLPPTITQLVANSAVAVRRLVSHVLHA